MPAPGCPEPGGPPAALAHSGAFWGDYHRRVASIEDTHWWFVSLRELVGQILSERLPAGSRIVEAGCGSGGLLASLGPRYERTGFDLDVTTARARVPDATFVEAGIEATPFPGGSFDAVIAVDVLYAAAVEDDSVALRECRRLLRSGGLLVLQVAAYRWLRSGHDVAVGGARRYTARAVGKMLQEAGFVGTPTYRVSLLFPLALVHRLATRNRVRNDIGPVHPLVNGAFAAVMRFENRMVPRVRLPFGLSVFAVAVADRLVRR